MIVRHFISPNAPLAELSADWFLTHFKQKILKSPVDFSKILTIVPTRSAARNFLNALFASGKFDSACGLKIQTFEDALSEVEDKSKRVKVAQTKAFWLSVLENSNLKNFTALFPNETPKRKDFLNFAEEIMLLQSILSSGLLTIKDAYTILQKSESFYDLPRFEELSKLESEFENKLKKFGLSSRLDANLDSVNSLVRSDFETVLILGNPEISALLAKFIDECDKYGKQVEIVIFSEHEEEFSTLGEPLEEVYCDKILPIKNSDIALFANIHSQVQTVGNLVKQYGTDAPKALEIACEQDENVEIFASKIKSISDIDALSLGEQTLQKTSLYNFIKIYSNFIQDKSFSNFLNFVRVPAVLNKLENVLSQKASEILSDLDTLREISCCYDFYGAQKSCAILLKSNYIKNDKFLHSFSNAKYLENLFNYIGAYINQKQSIFTIAQSIKNLFANAEDEDEQLAFQVFEESAENLLDAQEKADITFSTDEFFSIILSNLSVAQKPASATENALFLRDWMEIFWSDCPHILLCDMNDGIVPLASVDGIFMNDSTRKVLGLKNQKSRQARDAYMLETLYLTRSKNGYALKICVPQTSLKSDPLTPSRILFQCDELPERVNFLFAKVRDFSIQPPYSPEWKLSVPVKKFESSYSASKFKTYLDSPWMFYLKNVLKMEEVDTAKAELGANEFGTYFHEIMKRFANSNFKDSANEDEIRNLLIKEFENLRRDIFADSARAQIKMQLENLRNRAISCAKVQAEFRTQGWRILHAEKSFECELFGEKFTGIFDRIDVNDETGELMIIDYKTFETAAKGICKNTHLKESKSKEKGLEQTWFDLQLPLYRYALSQIYKDKNIRCAYFLSPKNTTGTFIDEWKNISEYEKSALECAREIIENIKNGNFEFKKPKYADFEDIFTIDIGKLNEIVEFKK